MATHFFWLFVATISIQVPNLLSMSQAATDKISIWDGLKITLMTLPVTILATLAYTMFYGNGSQSMSYPAMSVYAKVAALIAAILVQVVYLKSRGVSWTEIIGLALCVVGFIISVYGRR